ncbi:KPN_02809 family neutral zinc metallopeptidase [Streptomyces triticiradicis]|uniref:Zinc metallopeptidase n=1 Tax=Streptomyces triticiradicis TaxID=2651189 RepID=A0A7J5DEW2_9ACTN|nr:neutral zinc metallopeptidase [Streptomyces triticiradicis]KAB1987402.1 hypothetical protein F8144_18320 [Streptomyces triticiradicis]
MRFDDAGPDTSEARYARGGRVPGGRTAVGGGLACLAALALGLLFGVGTDRLGPSSDGDRTGAGVSSLAQVRRTCPEGRDADAREDCRAVAVVDSVQAYWTREFARRGGVYTRAPAVFFSGRVNTACGTASSSAGPFYCPGDREVRLDLGFLDDLRTKLGSGGPFAQAYVVAHEYGHHVQNLTGTLARSRGGANGDPVKVELQADCYAGVWARHATTAPPSSAGEPLLTTLTDADIRDGLDAAAAVGDDRTRTERQGRAAPETWAHGSAQQRRQWFYQGFTGGDMAQCDTFR